MTIGWQFTGQVAIVTGAGSGIGFAIAEALTTAGARVVGVDTTERSLSRAVGELGVDPCVGDVSDPATAPYAVSLAERIGGLDLLVNNAGIRINATPESETDDDWRRVMGVNLDGAFYFARAAGNVMIPRRSGAILNVASTAGTIATLDSTSYVVSKHGVVGLTRSLAVEWARYGIRVNAIAPGLTSTEMVRDFALERPELYRARSARIPIARAASPSEQAAAALFLLSDAASYITGHVLVSDGGGAALYSGYDAPAPA